LIFSIFEQTYKYELSFFAIDILNFILGEGCLGYPSTPLREKCLEGNTGLKKIIHRVNDFLLWRVPPLENA
jgi:hypothetical protein